MKREIKVEFDWFWPCLLLLVILTHGEPDLLDAIIHYLMTAAK